MFKVSFKKDYKKIQTFNDRATLVTLVGEMKMPLSIGTCFSQKVFDWMWHHPSVDVQWGKNPKNFVTFRIEITGKSVCAEGDVFNEVTGQRIAESRAKIKLFKFLYTLCERTMKYYYDIMYGNAEFGIIRESHTEAPKDCLYLTCRKYRELWVKESHHLEVLLKEA